jgi:hypothetical protein
MFPQMGARRERDVVIICPRWGTWYYPVSTMAREREIKR